MSKRRKKEYEKVVSETEEIDEKPAEEKAEKKEVMMESKDRIIGARKAFFYSIVIAVVFFGIGYLINPAITGQITAPTSTTDQFIFISPPGCLNCAELEPVAREVANTLGVPFVKTGFTQEMENPGFVLIYNDEFLGAIGFDSEELLKIQVCQITEHEGICEEAGELQPPEPPTPEVPKSDKPEAHAFIMSYCPYGIQFTKAYIPVIELLGDKADLEINFVHYIMHGEKEMTENTRMHCIQNEQKDKFTDYLRCFVEYDDPEKCMGEAGIDKNSVETCMQTTDDTFGLTKAFQESQDRFPPYALDAVLAQAYGVGGSPTFGINGQQVQVNRSPEAIKQAICSAFNSPPEECGQTLSSAPEAPGFGPVGSGGGGGSQAQC